MTDLTSSLTSGRLRFAVAELASLPRAAVVVEDRYSQIFKQDWARPGVVVDGLAELQIRYPSVPVVFCETRKMAEDWAYRFLAAAYRWSADTGVDVSSSEAEELAPVSTPSTAEVRAWARTQDIHVPDRGRLRSEVILAWQAAHR